MLNKIVPDDLMVAALTEARTGLLSLAPFWAHLLFSQMEFHWTRDIDTLATDEKNIYANPEYFMGLTVQERMFTIAHEIGHGMFSHLTRMKNHKRDRVMDENFSSGLYNRAGDYVINDLLVETGVGKFKEGWLWDTSIATHEDLVEDIYKKLKEDEDEPEDGEGDEPCEDGEAGEGDGEGGTSSQNGPKGHGGQDYHLEPSDEVLRDDISWTNAVAAAAQAQRAHGQGTLPAGLQRVVDSFLEAKVPWGEKVRFQITKVAGRDETTWSKPNRRMLASHGVYMPGSTGYGMGTIVVGVDTSGSVGDTELSQFMGEMIGMFGDLNPERIIVVWCDAQVNKTQEFFDAEELRAVTQHPGGGGTAFEPVFEWIDENMEGQPDVVIYLTDMHGSFPEEPDYPVIWGSIEDNEDKAPWGEFVHVEVG